VHSVETPQISSIINNARGRETVLLTKMVSPKHRRSFMNNEAAAAVRPQAATWMLGGVLQ